MTKFLKILTPQIELTIEKCPYNKTSKKEIQ